ncbi:capsular biosynthesis protein [Chelativorans sp. AA-79]|uniref:capsular biosynthesis protein n=1 Tax=Chelativorans sp. AA-79 TaxID=3028735 RepID=UPI0023F956F1|nr:capsular biosynthesis protein [Chelativorans sp. AA-79]WEX10249.1 capsular biosynthesis protein [Chelativorans sp. AA-79]
MDEAGSRLSVKPSSRRLRNGEGQVVLLQGPVGPFFRHLQHALEAAGLSCWRISFNAGDRVFAPRRKRIDFRGGVLLWELWFRRFLVDHDIDCIILFGCGRPFHAIARRLAREAGIRVVSLEEGYIRPGFVTIESDGNNAESPIAGLLPPEGFLPAAESPRKDFHGFRAMCLYGAIYYIARTVFSLPSERHQFHRRFSAIPEAFSWIRNAWRRSVNRNSDFLTIESLLEHYERNYFLVALQVASDAQMRAAARGWSTPRLIREVLASFARSAPKNLRLAFKIHPLQRGHGNEREFILREAEALGVADRVDVFCTGSIGLMTRHAAGVITINSSSGLSAIHHGVPLLVVGDALYANEALATCARGRPDFDAFWTSGKVASGELRRRYLAWIRQTCLKPGDFYARGGMPAACAGVLETIPVTTGEPVADVDLVEAGTLSGSTA